MSSTQVEDLFAGLRLKVAQSSFTLGDALIGKIKSGLQALAVYEGVKWFGEMIERSTEAAVNADRLGQRLGLSSAAVQQYQYAAEQSGVSTEVLVGGLQRLSRGFEEAKTKGTGPFAEGLQQLHIPMSEIRNSDLDDVVMRIADGFADAGPKVNKTAAAMNLGGRAFAAAIPLLNKGADGIRELRDEAYEMGAVIDGTTIKSFKEFEEQQKSLRAGLAGLRNTVVAALLPALTSAARAAVSWFRENREIIKQRLEQVFTAIGKALSILAQAAKAVYTALRPVVVAIIDIGERIYEAAQKSDGLRYALEAIAAVAAIVAIAVLEPWALVVAGIGLAILAGYDLVRAFQGQSSLLGDFFAALEYKIDHMTGSLGTAAQVWFNGIKGTFQLLKLELDEFLVMVNAIKSALEWVFDHGDQIRTITSGGFVGGGYSDKAKDFLENLGHDSDAEARARANGGFFGSLTAPQPTYGQLAQTSVLANAAPFQLGARGTAINPTFQANITFSGDVGDTTEAANKLTSAMHDFWNARMRELAAQSGG